MYENRIYIIFIIPTWHTIHLAVCCACNMAWDTTVSLDVREILPDILLFVGTKLRTCWFYLFFHPFGFLSIIFCRILYANPRSYTLIHGNYGGIDTRIVWIN